jgi:hypothetical protein
MVKKKGQQDIHGPHKTLHKKLKIEAYDPLKKNASEGQTVHALLVALSVLLLSDKSKV